jgi:hypothetical protein
MVALREGASTLSHEHFLTGIAEGKQTNCYPSNQNPYEHISASKEEERPHVFCVETYPNSALFSVPGPA